MKLNPIVGWRNKNEEIITWHKQGVPCGAEKGSPSYISFGTPSDSPTQKFCQTCYPETKA